ncbi:ankyrin repeat-containing domain protein [Schizothecium vesticola]|uniref:Ankyrin repeat-containing domain protein n=1 Tax=Schizothecium vesticola TaxID=314040 RepID=A0AA40F9X7_9PEZI|nr:ankyrin repeat-containing domain protein [Schizothecium vesticola]
MAEVISVAASAVTFVGAAITISNTVLSFISDLRQAPDEVLFLYNEVTDTRLILLRIKENVEQNQSLDTSLALPDNSGILGATAESTAKAEFLLKRIERVLSDIDLCLRSLTKSKSSRGVTINHRSWLLSRNRIKSLRQDLRDLKTNAALHFSSSSSTHAHRSVTLLKRVLLENTRTAQRQTERNDYFDSRLQTLAQQLAELSMIPESQQQLLALIEGLSVAAVASGEASTSSRTSTTTVTTTAVTTTGSGGDETQVTPDPAEGNQQAPGPSPQQPTETTTTQTTRSTTVTSSESVSRLKLEFSRFQKQGCIPDCECACHQRRRYKSPSFAQRLLGEFFLGFSSLPLLSKRCTDARCTQRSPFSATFTYYLPTFLLSKMVSLVFITTSQGDPAACVKIRPLSTDFSIYRRVEKGDTEGVRSLLDRRLAHPSATFKGAWTPLHYAISYGNTAIIRSLLARGADPTLEDGWNLRSPLEFAWSKMLGGAYDDDTQQEMETLFSDRDCVEEMGLTSLHRIVVGLSGYGCSLQDYISQQPQGINALDAHGRTALSWAAQRGMVSAVRSLLDAGADPNLHPPQSTSPLMYAAEARNPGCLDPLLEAGASVTAYDVEGQTALIYACNRNRDLDYYSPLIAAGADPEWHTTPGLIPLTIVIGEGFNDAMRYLVDVGGAGLDVKGHDQRPPVFYAVEHNNHDALDFLLSRGAAVTGVSSLKYPCLAHVAAHFADVRTLRMLTSRRLVLTDVDCVNSSGGLTIPQIVDNRLSVNTPPVEEGFMEAFGEFLASIRTPEGEGVAVESSQNDVGSGVGDPEGEFFDAAEFLA